MKEFNKVFILKIVPLSVSMLLLFTNSIYSYSIPRKYLRLPIGKIDDTLDRAKNKMKSTTMDSGEGKAAMLDLSVLTPREHGLLNQALGSFFNESQDIEVLTDKELVNIDPRSDLISIKDLKVYTFTKQQLRKALQI